MDYTVSTIAPIVLLPFFAFVINAFIVKKLPKRQWLLVHWQFLDHFYMH